MLFKQVKPIIQITLLVLILFAGMSLAMADKNGRYITVTGTGEVSAIPDTAWVSSGVNSQAKTAAEALKENNKLMEQVIDVFVDADIDKKNIRTSGFNVHPTYDYSQNSKLPKLVGYQVSNNVSVKVTNLKKLGELLDDIVESGSNQVSGIRFGFDDDEALLDEARKQAIENAKKKAKLFAQAADVDVGDVISINETGVRIPTPIHRGPEIQSHMSRDPGSVPVMSGEQEISASVTIVYQLED